MMTPILCIVMALCTLLECERARRLSEVLLYWSESKEQLGILLTSVS
jgi:hypothetical protein